MTGALCRGAWSLPSMLAVLAAVFAIPVLAQTPPSGPSVSPSAGAAVSNQNATPATEPQKLEPQHVEPVKINGKAESERARSTTFKIVVERDEITQYGDTSLLDVFRRLPGLTVTAAGTLQMRGLGGSYLQILLDGDPAPPGFSIESLSPDLIERIEILRAPSAQYSTQAIAGTVNIVLRKALEGDNRLDARYTVVNYNDDRSSYASATAIFSDGPIAVLAPINVARADSRSASISQSLGTNPQGLPDLYWIANAPGTFRSLTVTLAPRVTWQLAAHSTLTSDTLLQESTRSSQTTTDTTTVLGAPPPNAVEFNHARGSNVNLRETLTFDSRLDDGASANIKLGVSNSHRESDSYTQAFDNEGTFALNRSLSIEAVDQGATLRGKYSLPFQTDHVFVLGWDTGLTRSDYSLVQTDEPGGQTVPQDLDQAYSSRITRLAVFGQDEWDVTSRWGIYLGLRWEGLDTEVDGNDGTAVHNQVNVWSPILQTVWKLPDSASNQARLALSRTFRAPTTFELIPRRIDTINNTPTTPDGQGNPYLKPELAWGLDVALEHTTAGNGMLSAGAFARAIDDVIARQTLFVDQRYVNTPTNLSHAQTRGVEFDAKVNVQKVDARMPDIDIHANLTRAWSYVSAVPGPFNRLAAQTPVSANAGVDYRLSSKPLTVGGNLSFQDFGQFRSSFQESSNAGVARTADLYALWKFDRRVQLRVAATDAIGPVTTLGSFYVGSTGELTQLNRSPHFMSTRVTIEMHF